jgi:beta-lactam-binding protein with PASTA domain
MAALPDAYYDVTTVHLHDSEQPSGVVLRQTPCEGLRRKIVVGDERIAVKLVVSLGPRYETVPDLTGKDGRQAQIDLEKQGFSVNVIQRTTRGTITRSNGVLQQDPPAGCRLKAGSTVTLYVARPQVEASVQCPSLVGLDRMSALAALRSAGLTVGEITVMPTDDPITIEEPLSAFWADDTVVSQGRPAGCWLPKGTTVDLILKKKPSLYTKPQWQKGIIRPWNTAPNRPNFTEESSNA